MKPTIIKMPFVGDYKLTQKFGVKFRYRGKELKHQGVDWALPKNTPVVACFDGIVSRVEKWRLKGYGKSVYIRSSNSVYEALYAHLNSMTVKVGDKVKSGMVLGASGRTGFCKGKTGYHLHFGLKENGVYVDSLPFLYLPDQLKLPKNITSGYTVKTGDTLWGIAEQFYKDGDMWDIIFEANRDKIEDPKLIFPGQVLKIPEL